jgi:hypothetical protein
VGGGLDLDDVIGVDWRGEPWSACLGEVGGLLTVSSGREGGSSTEDGEDEIPDIGILVY